MRIATYNIEWFANLFSRRDKLLIDDNWSGRRDITRAAQIEAIAKVLSAIDADAILIVEAPNTGHRQSTTRALKNFANAFELRTRKAMTGFTNETQQELALLYDPDVMSARHDPQGAPPNAPAGDPAPRFDGRLLMDLDIDEQPEKVAFSKPPLEAEISLKNGQNLRLIGVHVKSKAPHGAKGLKDQIRISIENRRKQLAQCIWLRRRIDQHLDAKTPLIVLGDLNDGPGLDEYEHLFGRSGVEIVLGTDGPEDRRLYDPSASLALSCNLAVGPSTSRFFLHERQIYLNALLDYIMVSADLRNRAKKWTIWHPFDNPDCYNDPDLREALLSASDHFPVVLDLDLETPL